MNEPTALEAYEKYADELVRFASVLAGPSGAEDVVSAAVVRVLASPAWAEVRDHRAYLFRAVLNEALSQRRSTRRRLAREQRASTVAMRTELDGEIRRMITEIVEAAPPRPSIDIAFGGPHSRRRRPGRRVRVAIAGAVALAAVVPAVVLGARDPERVVEPVSPPSVTSEETGASTPTLVAPSSSPAAPETSTPATPVPTTAAEPVLPGEPVTDVQFYMVAIGDTLMGISGLYCVDPLVVAAYNGWSDGLRQVIYPGYTIAIPSGSCRRVSRSGPNVRTIETDVGVMSYVLSPGTGPDPLELASFPDFVVAQDSWVVESCCRLKVTVESIQPPFPDDELVTSFESNGLTWRLFDGGPGDGTLIIATTTIEGGSVLISAQSLIGDVQSVPAPIDVAESVARSLVIEPDRNPDLPEPTPPWSYIGTRSGPARFENDQGVTLGRFAVAPTFSEAFEASPEYISIVDPTTGLIAGFADKYHFAAGEVGGTWAAHVPDAPIPLVGEDATTVVATRSVDGTVQTP